METTTELGADEVLARAKTFFANRPSLYSTFLDKEGPGFASFRGQGGEEIVIGVSAGAGRHGHARHRVELPVRHAGRALLLDARRRRARHDARRSSPTLRSRGSTIQLAPAGASAITIRVEMPEVWDVVRIAVAPDASRCSP